MVTKDDLERQLQKLESELQRAGVEPAAGIFGPQSLLWEINRESVLFLGSGRAALLQLAHPYVAAGIDQHSRTGRDPIGRFHRTFAAVFDMVFGDRETAFETARAVHQIHNRIVGRLEESTGRYARGHRYSANERQALLWVHATLWDTSVRVFEQVVRPLEDEEKERYYLETRRFASLFGLSKADLPPGWSHFEAYNREMWTSDRLAVGQKAIDISAFLLQPPQHLTRLALGRLRPLTAGLLPEPVRHGFDRFFDARDPKRCERTLARVRRTHRFWPQRLRYTPLYIAAQRRLAGLSGRDRVGELLIRLYTGRRRSASRPG